MKNNDSLRKLVVERLGLTMSEFAVLLGYKNASSVQRYFSDEFSEKKYPIKFSHALANSVIGKGSPPITEQDIENLSLIPMNNLTSNATLVDNHPMPENRLPVYGEAVAGIRGEFLMNGQSLFEVMAPPNLTKSSGAYAVQVSGDSMAPRFNDGEIVLVDPNKRVAKGDDVVAQIVNESDPEGPPLAFVKTFVSHNSETLTLMQFNPEEELVFQHKDVVSVHYIAGMQKR